MKKCVSDVDNPFRVWDDNNIGKAQGAQDMTTATTIAATPTKLRNGAWGARTQGHPDTGETITITTRSGKTWDATVTRVLWTGTDNDQPIAIVATATGRSLTQTTCDQCHSAPGTRTAVDSSGLHGVVCRTCDGPSYTLSFA